MSFDSVLANSGYAPPTRLSPGAARAMLIALLVVGLPGLGASTAWADNQPPAAAKADAEPAKAAAEAEQDDDETKAEFSQAEMSEAEEAAEVSADFKAALAKAEYRFTPEVVTAYVEAQKAQARAELKALGKQLPAEFLGWVDGDGVVRATVYGSPKPSHVLLMLYSLSPDVGDPRYKRYKNWLLAAAVKNARQGPKANITPRAPLKLEIPGDPRQPVNTKDSSRPLDKNDHIINFLEDNKLVASDVMYNADWQQKFNASMAEKGQDARVNCSMKLGPGSQKEKRAKLKDVMAAYRMFQTAYEEKGRIPKQKDPRIGLREWVVLQVDNHESGKTRSGFPLDKAPWPVLTALLSPRLSLREAYNMNRGGGEAISKGHYKLNAFSTEMLKAVDVRPFPYAEGSWYMIKKHGGACGTRAMLAANQNKAYGLPSATVGEIGHASWVEFPYFKKSGRFRMKFEGGGHNPAVLSVHQALPISRGRQSEKASNWETFLDAIQSHGGVQPYMESMMAVYTLRSLNKDEQQKYGGTLKASALALHPGNILLSGEIEKNAAESVAKMKKERWRKNHAGQ